MKVTMTRTQEKICAHCGSVFSRGRDRGHNEWAQRRYCSRACGSQAAWDRRPADAAAYFDKHAWPEPSCGCWLWTGYVVGTLGYGSLKHNRRAVRAHRYAYERFVGPIPEDMVVRHTCDTPACVNPQHLCLGWQADNIADAVKRGRWRSGKAKLTHDAVRAIRGDNRPAPVVAAEFGVTRNTITRVRSGETWGGLK